MRPIDQSQKISTVSHCIYHNSLTISAAISTLEQDIPTQSAVNLGPVTVTEDGATHVVNEDRRQGKRKEIEGNIKEAIGTATNNDQLKEAGKRQAQEGHTQNAIGKATDWVKGAANRVRGGYF